jgi:glycosyltransferase involved in cell wall biosynthesis
MNRNSLNSAESTRGWGSKVPPSSRAEQLGQIVLAGHFDPVIVARLLPSEVAARLAGLSGPPAVPIHHLAGALAGIGVKTTVLGGLQDAPHIYLRSNPTSVALYNKRGSRAFSLTGFHRERKAALEHLRQIRPSLVHAHWTMEAARAVADWAGPKILTVHDAAYEYARIGWRWQLGTMAYKTRWLANTRATLKKFDHVIAVSPFVEAYLRLRHRFQGEIRVIPNAIPPLPRSIEPVNTFPKTDRLTFGCYGGPDQLKNLGTALKAFRIVQGDLPNSRLVIFGDGWNEQSTSDLASSVEVRGRVRHDEFLRCLASEVDIWVHPSRIEAHPISICEAIQSGCPVVAGQTSGGVAWTLDYGRAGCLVNIERPKDIAKAMLGLIRNREWATDLICYGRRMILDRFSPDRVLNMHVQYYQDVIQQWDSTALSESPMKSYSRSNKRESSTNVSQVRWNENKC